MTKIEIAIPKMNLHLFDEGAAGAADGAQAATEEGATGEQKKTHAAGATGEPNETHAADATPQEGADPAGEDARTRFKNYIKGEGREFFIEESNKRSQRAINRRFAETKVLEENAKTLEPMLKAIARKVGVDRNDLGALVNKVLADDWLFEDRARENGMSVDAQRQLDMLSMENEAIKAQKQESSYEEIQAIWDRWEAEAEELQKKAPEFDMDACMENKVFYDLISRGYSVEHAYNCAFPEELEKRLEAQAEKRITDNIKARGKRPQPNGVKQTAATTQTLDLTKLSDEDFFKLGERARRGELVGF